MGYELKIYVGRVVAGQSKLSGAAWFQVLGMVELFKVGDSHISNLPKDGTPIYMYDLDGNVEYDEDNYGDKLIALDPRKTLDALRRDLARWPDVLVLRAAAAMLQALLDDDGEVMADNWRLGVVLYGH